MRRLMRDEWQFGLGQISSLQRHPKPEISTGPPHPNTRLPMPKDNEVDEKATEPVAVIYPDSGLRNDAAAMALWRNYGYDTGGEPLYSAATVDELRARADAAERRVGELEAALSDLISVADPLALARREYERTREQTARGTRISIDPFPLLKCRYEDVVDLTDDLKRARAALTGADPT